MVLTCLPGFIDIHLIVQELGSVYKENINYITDAALRGGFTMVLTTANIPPIIDQNSFQLFKEFAFKQAVCEYALFFTASENNFNITCEYITQAAGLKMSVNGNNDIVISDMTVWKKHFENWPKISMGPIISNAKSHRLASLILIAHLTDRPIHITDVSTKDDIFVIRSAKQHGVKVTCDICIRNLFLSNGNYFSDYASELIDLNDQKVLWDNLDFIDIFTTQHIGQTSAERQCSNVSGFPSLETSLQLLLDAVVRGRLRMEQLIQKLYTNPKKIFNLPDQPDTYITVDLNKQWTYPLSEIPYSNIRWAPFNGRTGFGTIIEVVLRGKIVYNKGKVLATPGYGQNVRCENYNKSLCSCKGKIMKIINDQNCSRKLTKKK